MRNTLEFLYMALIACVFDVGLVVEPGSKPRYSLDELLAQCEAATDVPAEDRA